jgi:protein-glutamine gamma-glutamyltransferase
MSIASEAGHSRARTRAERLSLLAIVGAAWTAYAVTTRPALLWPYLVALGVSARFRSRRTPPLLARVLSHVQLACGLITALIGILVTLYPVLSAEAIERLLHLMGGAFASLALLAAFDGTLARPARSIIGSAVGLLVVASLQQPGETHPLIMTRFMPIVSAVIVAFFLASETTIRGSQPTATRRFARRATEGALMLALSLAVGFVLVRLLPWTQPRVEGAIAGLMDIEPTRATTGMGDTSMLGAIEELALSDRVVLRVWTAEPRNLRARVHERFDGRTWSTRPRPERAVEPEVRPLPESSHDWAERTPGATFWLPGASTGPLGGLNAVTVLQSALAGERLLAPASPAVVRAAATRLYLDGADLLTAPALTTVEIYGVLSQTRDVPAARLTDEERLDYLSISHRPDPRLRELARELGGETDPPTERATRTVSYLQHHCRYSLRVGRFASADPVAEFVFDKRQGYCEYFASAAAILLRLQGVPTRYVTGFHVSDLNRSGNHYVVRESDAHAWVEAFLPLQGWVAVDPTPPGDFATVHRRPTRWWSTVWETVRTEVTALSAKLRSGAGLAVLRGLARYILAGAAHLLRHPILWVAALLMLLFRRYRIRHASPPQHSSVSCDTGAHPPPELRDALALMETVWRRTGVERPANHGLLEQLDAVIRSGAADSVKELSRALVVTYYRAAFGGSGRSLPERHALLRDARKAATKR